MLCIQSHDGVRLAADVSNDGARPTLLLLPCGAELRSVWHPVIAQLAPSVVSTWRIVAADHRGHGNSGRSEVYRFDQFLRDLHCWIAALHARPLIIAGGSIGGALGMVAAGEGNAIDGLVLLDVPTVPILDKVLDERSRIVQARDAGHPAMQQVDPGFIASGFIEDCFTDIDRWRRAANRIAIPTLLICAKNGAMGRAALREQFRRDIAHCEVEELDTGHLVARGDPVGVARYLNAFIERHFAQPWAPNAG